MLEPAERIVHTRHDRLGSPTRVVASQALLDYLGVTLAGAAVRDACLDLGALGRLDPLLQPLRKIS